MHPRHALTVEVPDLSPFFPPVGGATHDPQSVPANESCY